MAKGGARPGAGRKPGGKNETTLEKDRTLAMLRQRILTNAQSLFNAAKSAAVGNQYLYKIVTRYVGKGKNRSRVRSAPQLVRDPVEIANYIDQLDRENRGDEIPDEEKDHNTYYFISTKEPNIKAIEDLFNRAFGKPKEELHLSGGLNIGQVLDEIESKKK